MANPTTPLLVVDDNEMNRDMLSRRLRRQGYAVDVAADGEEALAMIMANDYALILLDIMMPKLDGYGVLQRLKADEHKRHVPIIMVSAVDDLDSVVRCIELGAEDYLFKPFNPVLLKARVEATLSKAHRLEPSILEPHLTAMDSIVTELHDQAAAPKAQLDALRVHMNALQSLIK